MARLDTEGIDELVEELEKLGKLDEVAPRMIRAAAPVLVHHMKSNIELAANRGYATGELAKSIKATKAKKNVYGHFAAVGPTGTDANGTRNGEKMAYLEYGVSGRQEAHPVMTKTINDSENEAIEKMQQIFDAEVSG